MLLGDAGYCPYLVPPADLHKDPSNDDELHYMHAFGPDL